MEEPTTEAPVAPEDEAGFEALLDYLRDHRGADFTGYRRPSLTRLVARRMSATGVPTYEDYVRLLEVEPRELSALLDTLLINVTSFFRDEQPWEELRANLLPVALAQLDADEPVRAWSAACATGQEAYSVAILLHELLGDEAYHQRVKVYATDVDEGALRVARAGRYTEGGLAGLSEEQRRTYFVPDGDGFRFHPDLRHSVIFGRHHLLQDAPISRVLLLTCRNVLMYFNPETQRKVLERFPYALHEHGLLMLGKAEMLLTQSPHFLPVSRSHRIFRARHTSGASRLAALAMGGPGQTQLRRVTDVAFVAAPDPQLVVNGAGELVLCNERAERDLGVDRSCLGRQFSELAIAVSPQELRGAVAAVLASGEQQEFRDVPWSRGAATHWDIRVAPLPDGDAVIGAHVLFRDSSQQHELRSELERAQQDLVTVYEEVQSASEELETTNEELQSTIEELETTNEELQSTNEELETMNEELQSTNEELQAVNDELRERTLQVDEANAFLQGVVEAIGAAIAVVGPDYRVLLWNPGAERLTGRRAFEAEGLVLFDLELGVPVDELHGAISAVVNGQRPRVAVRGGAGATERVVTVTSLRGGVRGALVTLEEASAAY